MGLSARSGSFVTFRQRPMRQSVAQAEAAGEPSEREDLNRRSRSQRHQASPPAVRAILDGPRIHIRLILPASAGATDKSRVSVGRYRAPSIASTCLRRNSVLRRECQELDGRGPFPELKTSGNSAYPSFFKRLRLPKLTTEKAADSAGVTAAGPSAPVFLQRGRRSRKI
jgi:hypothetical protein